MICPPVVTLMCAFERVLVMSGNVIVTMREWCKDISWTRMVSEVNLGA